MSKWVHLNIKEIALVKNGSTPPTKENKNYDNGNIVWITPNDLSKQQKKYVIKGERNISEYGYKNCSTTLIPQGSILLSSRAPIGLLAIAGVELCTNQGFKNLVPNSNVNSSFLYYYLKTKVKEIEQLGTGTTFKEISKSAIENFSLFIPCNINDQQRIVSVLSSLDDKIELNNRVNAELEAMAKTLYDYWFVQFDFPDANGKPYKSSGGKMVYNEELKREIPEGWEVIELNSITPVSNSSVNPFENINTLYKHYSIPVFDEKKTYKLEYGNEIMSNKFSISENDVLVSKLNPWFNRVVYVPKIDNQICSTEFVVWRTPNTSIKNYLYLLATNKHFISYCTQMAAGTSNSHKRVNPEVMMKYKVIFNKEVIDFFGMKINPFINQIQKLNQENQRLSSLRDWLLPMLMNGQVGFKEEHQEQVQTVSVAAEANVEYKPSNPKNDKYRKIQSVYVVLWANSLLGVKQGEMATAKDLYLVDRIAGVHTGFTYAQHSWGSFDPAFKQTINNKYFTKRNFPNSPAHYCDTADNGYLLAKIPEDTKEKVKSSIEELHHKIFKKYFGKQKAEMKELYATVLKCIEDAQSTTFAVIRQTMKDWKTPKQNFPDKAIKFSEQLTKEALDMIIREGWDRNVMRNER